MPRRFSPAWLPYLIIPTVLISLSGLFLLPSAWEFPMDDTYIHFVYAQNLAETGRLAFNTPGEVGVGSTSLTWVLLLAGAIKMGIPVHLAAKALGLLSLVAVGLGLYRLYEPLLEPVPALLLALLTAASGHLVWFALSGMETMLFLAAGTAALLLYRACRWGLLGLALGLLALTRPDGLALAAALGLVELWRCRWNVRRLPSGLFLAGAACFLVCAPWFGYLLARTGHILPTSAVGKQTSSLLGIRLVLSSNPALSWLADFPAVIYAGTWIGYLLEFALGGMAFPGPGLPVGAEVGNASYSISTLGILGWALVVLPLTASFFRWAWRNLRRSTQPEAARPWILFAAWLVLHNLAYAFFLPIPGTASRYGTVNHVALWLGLFLGLLHFTPRRMRGALAAGLLVIACANTLYWNRVYDANLEHMRSVRIAAAQYMTETVAPAEPIAAFDVGVIRYYSGRKIIDLGGLIDPELGDVYRTDGKIDRYLADRGVRVVALPGRTNTTREGWFDFAREMGLTTSALFRLREIKVFEIDHDRWLLGYLPTNNYQATVTIYRLEPK